MAKTRTVITAFTILVLLLGGVASAATTPIVILQGGGERAPVAYLGETVDMALVLGFQQTIAWWSNDNNQAALPPDIIIQITSYQHAVYLDPMKYKVGTWFKWDGAYEAAANNIAFEIYPGVRPAPIVTATPTIDPMITLIPEKPTVPAATHIVMARGDTLKFKYGSAGLSGNGYLWYFGNAPDSGVYGVSMNTSPGVYSYTFLSKETQNLVPGWYTGYLQTANSNGWQDVFYNAATNSLDSPYKSVMPVKLDGFIPTRVQAELDVMRANKQFSDDQYVSITLEVKDPYIRITQYYEQADNIIVEGVTSLSEGTEISFILDPDHYPIQSVKGQNTIKVKATGDLKADRNFKVSIPVNWGELSLGAHPILATVDKGNIHLTTEQDVRITMIWVNPAPTQIGVKLVVEEYGSHVTNASEQAFIQTVNGTIQMVPTVTPKIVYVDRVVTIYLTPVPVYTFTPVPTTPPESPLPPWLGIVAVGICVVIVLKRR
jgi:hypothetical protein